MEEQIYTNCTIGGPVFVYVRDGKVVRIRPIVLDESDAQSFTIEARGKKFTPPRKATLAPQIVADRTRLYSDERLKYPLKRVDFDPNGDRHPENRGKSAYVRIGWDEALDMVAGEMKRIRTTYGKEAIWAKMMDHPNWGYIHYRFGSFGRFFQLLGHTYNFHNPDSWEGWHWGGPHMYGHFWRLGCSDQSDLLEEVLKNSELVVYWASDPDTTRYAYGGQDCVIWRQWIREAGIKQIFIDPFCNYTAATPGDKWIAPRPGTDPALAMAIAYVWIEEDTYDKNYIATKTIGFDQFKWHIMGKDDGVPKTPKWAEEITGIPARVIAALAKEWASKRTCLGAWFGTACRAAYGTEFARMLIALITMQGYGKPGVTLWNGNAGAPTNPNFKHPGYSDGGEDALSIVAKKPAVNSVTQRIYRPLAPDCILNPPVSWLGEGFCAFSIEQQFKPYTYPEPGKSEVKMLYSFGGPNIGTMADTNRWVKMYQSPKLELVVNQDCWWNSETKHADIILPACTNYERTDIAEWSGAGGYAGVIANTNHRIIVYMKKCIEPLWESKSDYDIFSGIAERLGIKESYTEGNTDEDWAKKIFDKYSIHEYISYEDFKKKGYFVVPLPEDRKFTPAFRWFYEGRGCDTTDYYNPKKGTDKAGELGTYSGKIEFVSQSLLKFTPDDDERPPMPRYIPSWEGHTSKLAKKYPLQLISPHPRATLHTSSDSNTPWLGDIPDHRVCKDGYYYRVARIHPSDANARGIKDKDIVKLYNDRGATLCIAEITERIRPGVVHSASSSSKYDPLNPGKSESVDRGGCVNLLTPPRMMSKNVAGFAVNSCLIEISKWEV